MYLCFCLQQLSHIPSGCSANFDFSKKGLLVFTDSAITNGNAHRSSNNLTVSGLFPWNSKSGNENFNSVIQQMAQVKLYFFMGTYSFISLITTYRRNLYSLFFALKCVTMCFVCLYYYIVRRY